MGVSHPRESPGKPHLLAIEDGNHAWSVYVRRAGWAERRTGPTRGDGLAHAPSADTPSVPPRAVESLNFTGLAQFEFSEEDWPTGPDTMTENQVRIGGWLTAPLGDSGGIRLALDGGTASRSLPGLPSGTGHSSVWLSNVGGDVFLRDPNKGYVQLGYRWNRARHGAPPGYLT